jgi:hypothetical protein
LTLDLLTTSCSSALFLDPTKIKTQKGYIEQITYFLQNILVSKSKKYGRTTRGGEPIPAQDAS